MSDTRAVVFHNSYATGTGTETLRVTTLSPAAIFVKAPTSIASLSFALHDASHAINAASVVSVCRARRLVGQS